MASDPIQQITGKGVYIPGDDIDTDRIIPARFMKCITFDGLGEYLFYDVRKTELGKDKQHNLNDTRFSGASIIVTGNNFGCGSSREHAPQSIFRAGYRAVIAGSFAEIFFGNSTNLGIICASVSESDRRILASAIEDEPGIKIIIDLENKQVRFGSKSVPFEIKEGARESLLNGSYDPLDELLEGAEHTDQVAQNLAYMAADR